MAGTRDPDEQGNINSAYSRPDYTVEPPVVVALTFHMLDNRDLAGAGRR